METSLNTEVPQLPVIAPVLEDGEILLAKSRWLLAAVTLGQGVHLNNSEPNRKLRRLRKQACGVVE